jgi:hypothetical protein
MAVLQDLPPPPPVAMPIATPLASPLFPWVRA